MALLVGCVPAGPAAVDDEFQKLAAEYMRETGARPISSAELETRLKGREPVVLLDIREPHEHAVSALPGAILVTPDTVSTRVLEFPAKATVVAYCTAGYRSGIASVELEKRLGRAVLNLEGGIIAWFNRGGLVVDPSEKPIDHVHPYGDAWQKYVRPRRAEAETRSHQ